MRTIHRLLRKEFCTSPPSNVGTRLANLPDRRLQALATSWRNSLRSEYGGYRWIVDKMPSNVFLLGLVHVSFPDAPIVLVERDPVALACSCFVTPFSEGQYFSRRIETIVHYFAKFRQILRHWESVLPTGRILRIRYEDVLIDTEAALSPLLDRMNLCWERDMLNFHQRSDPVTTASLFQVRRALDPSATDRWRRFEPQLGPWRERLEQAYWHGEIMSDDIVAR